jgi:hypothetical protein
MDATRRSGIVDGLESMTAAGRITRYTITWEGREPKVTVWRACDTPDADLRKTILDGMAGLVAETQLTVLQNV